MYIFPCSIYQKRELIETLWNVNTDNLRAINGDGTN